MRLAMTISLPRHSSSVTRARRMLAVLLSLTDATEEHCHHLAILITEACANAVIHGATSDPVELAVAIDGDTCRIEVGNRGDSPTVGRLTAKLPDPAQSSGRGLPLIAALSDSAAFLPAPAGRVLLRITRRIRTGPRTDSATDPGS